MALTIAIIHARVTRCIELMRAAIGVINAISDGKPRVSRCDWLAELREIERVYDTRTSDIVATYYADHDNETACTAEYYATITQIGLQCRLDALYGEVSAACSRESLYATAGALEHAMRSVIIQSPAESDHCGCGGVPELLFETMELRCRRCGMVTHPGICHDQRNTDDHYGRRAAVKHFKTWMDSIQAKDTKGFNAAILARLNEYIDQHNYDRRELDCETLRKLLKSPAIRATELNSRIPALLVALRGRAPPKLNDAEYLKTYTMFMRLMDLYDDVFPDRGHKPYYPYFIYQVIWALFRQEPEKLRLLNYLHLQDRETVANNDRKFDKICERAKTLGIAVPAYRPIDPTNVF